MSASVAEPAVALAAASVAEPAVALAAASVAQPSVQVHFYATFDSAGVVANSLVA